jgi:poly-gamma-glutamate synthesis protein (capsule biosynthesis protein)
MLGRGIDQILPHPCDPELHEAYAQSALDYVRLAELSCGTVPRPREPAAIWGAASAELERADPDARIINLETSITRSDTYVPKGINYRMSPENAACLSAARIDCCVLANNHILDFGRAGLRDTLARLRELGIATAGAGHDLGEARAPAILDIAGKGRVVVIAFACATSGVPLGWTAGAHHAGVSLLTDSPEESVARIAEIIERHRRPGDIFIVSIHWGANWGYGITEDELSLAHGLVERAGVSVVHGHSSHHAKAIEITRDRLVLYGCGDFLNDYEGIGGEEEFRGDLALMYLADFEISSGTLAKLEMIPLEIKRLSLEAVSAADLDWLQRRLDRESAPFATRIARSAENRLAAFSEAARSRMKGEALR